jgi:hypothetical protein
MKTNDQDQKSVYVKQHKRMAMGEKLDGQSLKGGNEKKGGLEQAKEKK